MPQTARKTVVVTGGSAGVGRAVAVAFARRGWNVGILARGRDGVRGAVDEVDAAGGHGLGHLVDVADAKAVDRAADDVAKTFGGIDVWINNAMVTVYAPVREMPADEFLRVTQVSYLGQVHGMQAALRHMDAQGGGTIVNVGSALAYRSIPLQSAYCAAKAAVRGFTDSLRCELLHEDSPVRLTMVQLPAVNTPQFDWARSRLPRRLQPVPPIFEPAAIAEKIFGAAMDAPRELWIGEPSVLAIVGTMIAPGFADRYLARHGVESQMTDEPRRGKRSDNLFKPVSGDPGAQGRFADRSRGSVTAYDPVWLKAGLLAAAGVVLGGLAAQAHREIRDAQITGSAARRAAS